MNAVVVSAIMTACGTLFGTVLTVYFNVIRKPQQSTGDALVVKNSAARATENAGQIVNHIPFERDDSVPFDSAIMFALSSDQNIIKLPPRSGVYFGIVFMTGWLIGWTAAIFFTGFTLFQLLITRENSSVSSMDLFGVVFLFGWLIAAIAGEFAVINSLFKEMTKAFGRRYLWVRGQLRPIATEKA